MKEALKHAENALIANDVPVGALIVNGNGEIMAAKKNESKSNPLGHAEILAMNAVKYKKGECYTLYSTLEPCAMCAGAILNYGIKKVVFGAYNEKEGACGSKMDLLRDFSTIYGEVEVVSGVMAKESKLLLKRFFKELRD
jgi:tRNA(adenine34) deaminase